MLQKRRLLKLVSPRVRTGLLRSPARLKNFKSSRKRQRVKWPTRLSNIAGPNSSFKSARLSSISRKLNSTKLVGALTALSRKLAKT